MDRNKQTGLVMERVPSPGATLSSAQVALGASTKALVRYNSAGSPGWLDGSSAKDSVEVIAGDIRDGNDKSRTVTSEKSKVSQFWRIFKYQHYALLDNEKFRNVLEAFEYEW